MTRFTHTRLLLACLVLLCLSTLPLASAQLTGLPTITSANANTKGGSSSASGTDSKSTGSTASSVTSVTSVSSASSSAGSSTSSSSSVSLSTPATTNLPTTSTPAAVSFSPLPTIAGVGIPTMVVPYTANAPYMQKSALPEGTVFITVGAVLAFLGFCVIGWRALVAWSINRSVKRAALASIMASETKNPGGWANNPFKPAGGFYSQAPGGSTVSLSDHTTKRGAPFRNPVPSNASGLFFSPTASNTNTTANIPMTGLNHTGNRASSLLPAGYYASPSAQLGGGASQTSIGGGAQHYTDSPNLQARRVSNQPMPSLNLAPPQSRESRRISTRPSSSVNPSHSGVLHPQTSANSLAVSTGHGGDDLPGTRAPSAYLEDLFEGHGSPAMPSSQPHH